jgi:hypothetical protein
MRERKMIDCLLFLSESERSLNTTFPPNPKPSFLNVIPASGFQRYQRFPTATVPQRKIGPPSIQLYKVTVQQTNLQQVRV